MKAIVRFLGFLSKELREIIRQPGLIVVLILGPFLILFLFGLGHSATQPPLMTLLVVPNEVTLPVQPHEYQQLFGAGFQLVGTTHDAQEAADRVKAHEVDLALVIPADLYERLDAGEQAPVTILYDEIDPVLTNYIRFLTSSQVAEMNRRVLEAALRQTLQPAGQLDQFATGADQELAAIPSDVAAGDAVAARQHVERLDATSAAFAGRLDTLSRFFASSGDQTAGRPAIAQITNARAALGAFRDDLATLRRDIDDNQDAVPRDVERARSNAGVLATAARGANELPAAVIAAPLVGRTENLAAVEPDFVGFYAPAVLALLLQHIAVTFGALSIVRERLFGAMELFRVAPVSALQVLLGKYLAYLLVALVVTGALLALLVFQLRVPFLGEYRLFVFLVAGLLLASLGAGFCISLLSRSESQAVQLSMLFLIASVFFSGFFLRLDTFRWPIRAVAYLLPVTYGISSLQEVMLRGARADYVPVVALSALAAALFALAWILLRAELGRGSGQSVIAE